jgi:hypothetical protein
MLAVVLVAVALASAPGPTPAEAQVPLLDITDVSGPPVSVTGDGGTQAAQASCPAGRMPLSGFVTSSAPDDVRRLFETFGTGDAGTYLVGVVNFGGGTLQVTATVRCVPSSQFGFIHTQSGTFDAAADHVAEGTVTCPDGWLAINADVTEPHSPERTLLTSTPTIDLTGWSARAWVGDPSDPDEVMTIDVHCVQAASLPGIRVATHLDAVGWGAAASVACPWGLVPAYGGTSHAGGDRGAITVHQRPTATGWTSTTLSLSDGSMQSTVACVPNGYPAVELAGSSGITTTPSASWTFTALDPAGGGGYSVSYTCTFLSAGIGTLPKPCTSPVNRTNLADGLHRIQVYARTSDGRVSPTVEAVLTVDTTGPTVTMTQPALFPIGTSATPTWSGLDATTGVASYALRRRRTPLLGDPGAWTAPRTFGPDVTSRTYGALIQGSTYCYSVRATDVATNNGGWAIRCTAIPLDDRALNKSAGWTDTTKAGWFQGTAVQTTTRGATLTKSATTKRLALVALRCPTCGTVGLFVAGTQVATIDLSSSTTRRQLITVPAFALATGTVALKVLTDGKLVQVDALSMSRS